MADAPTLGTVFLSVVPVVVGGLLGFAGAFLSQRSVHRWQAHLQRHKSKSDKFEELVAAVEEYDHWLDMKRNRLVFGEDKPETLAPYAKMYAIACVYFPEFIEQLKKLKVGGDKFQLWMYGRARKRLDKKMDELTDGYQEAFFDYNNAKKELEESFLRYADKEFRVDTSKVTSLIR